jgi:Flp pilus assembly protein TadG
MLKLLQRFAKDKSGLAALEFALIAPLMVMMFYGAVELSGAVDCNSRVSRVGYTVADLVAQSASVSSTDTANIFACANAILFPYAPANAKMVVSSLTYDATGKVTVAWSDVQNATKRTTAPSDFPATLMLKDSNNKIIPGSVILAEINYTYTAPITYFLGGPVTLKDSFYAKPRRSTAVTHS